MATLGTQDTGRRQTKQKLQDRKPKRKAIRTPPKTRGEPRCPQADFASYMTPPHITHIVNICWTPLYANKHK